MTLTIALVLATALQRSAPTEAQYYARMTAMIDGTHKQVIAAVEDLTATKDIVKITRMDDGTIRKEVVAPGAFGVYRITPLFFKHNKKTLALPGAARPILIGALGKKLTKGNIRALDFRGPSGYIEAGTFGPAGQRLTEAQMAEMKKRMEKPNEAIKESQVRQLAFARKNWDRYIATKNGVRIKHESLISDIRPILATKPCLGCHSQIKLGEPIAFMIYEYPAYVKPNPPKN